MRPTRSRHNSVLALTVLTLTLSLAPAPQSAYGFTAVKSGSVGGTPIRPGELLTTGMSTTFYFVGHTVPNSLNSSPTYDAVAWFNRSDPGQPNWIEGGGGDAWQCLPYGDGGGIRIAVPLLGGPSPLLTGGRLAQVEIRNTRPGFTILASRMARCFRPIRR